MAPAAFNSGLMQPLFTELANLLQNTRRASELSELSNSENNRREVIAICVGFAHNVRRNSGSALPLIISVDTLFAFSVQPMGNLNFIHLNAPHEKCST
jgi:hypothetical protein